jgi:hypothetical protein
MGRGLLNISQLIIFIIYILEFIIAVRLTKIKTVKIPFKYFWLYPLVGFLVSSLAVLSNFKLISKGIAGPVNTTSLLFHYSFISYIFFKANSSKAVFKWVAFAFFMIIAIFVKIDLIDKNSTPFSIANGALFIYALYFLVRYLNADNIINLTKDPFFFICTGILLGTTFIVPTFLMTKYLLEIKTEKSVIFYFVAASNIGYITINLFFIKALLVARKNSLDVKQKENIALNN